MVSKIQKRQIRLNGPEGNAFCLLGIASGLAKKHGLNEKAILEEMQSGDYNNLTSTMYKYFKKWIQFV